MSIQFPNNPSVNEAHSVNGRTYVWNGKQWRRHRPRIEYVPPTMEVINDFTAGSALKVDAENSSVGIGTMSPNAGDALTVAGDTTMTGNLVVDGYITVPTQVAGTNDTKVATTEYVTTAISDLIGGAPAALDTLNELAAALDDDASYAATITNALSLKLDSSSYTAADVLAKLITVDGTGSSLDADTLDGSHASAFATSSHTHSYAASSHTHSYLSNNTSTEWTSGQFTFRSNDVLESASGDQATLEVYQDTAGADAFMQFHVANDHAAYFGLKGDINDFAVGGWSKGANYYRVWHAGNDGSGSGLDADTLDGSHASAFAASSHSHSYASTSHTHSYAAVSHSHSGGMNYWDAGSGLAYGGATVGGGTPNAIGFRWANPYVNCTVDNVISAAAANFSDKRLKTNITAYSDGISALRLLQPVTYSPLDVQSFDLSTGEPIVGDGEPGSPMLGFIADDVQEVVPSAVSGTGIQLKSIDTIQLVSVIVSALKDIDVRLSALESV